MGGILGLIKWRGEFPTQPDIFKMSRELVHRGMGNIQFSRCKKAGLVQLLDNRDRLYATCDKPSKWDSNSSNNIIVFHGRIDNKQEIHQQLDTKIPLSRFTDESICLAAFENWGEEFIDKLIGDFAFAIWNEQSKSLYCFRDHMGVKPFYYISTPYFFVFASEIKAILTLPFIRKEINAERVADYLLWFATEEKATFYKNIFRLQPSHFLVVDRSIVSEKKYWSPPEIQLSNQSFERNSEHFYHIFKEAIRARMPKAGSVGSFLSGGVDSSSIVCVAVNSLSDHYAGNFNTFSHIYKRLKSCDEERYLKIIVDLYKISPHFIEGDRVDPAFAFDCTAADEDEPFEGPHFFTSWHLLHLVKEQNIQTLFDGHDGDSVLSLGVGLFPELAQSGKLHKLYSEILACNPKQHKRALKLFMSTYKDYLKAKTPFLSYVSGVETQLEIYQSYLLPELLKSTHARDRVIASFDDIPLPLQSEQHRHFNNVFQPFHSHALEFLERSASRSGACACFPFFDIRLILFCLSLPAEQKLRHGLNRAYVRESLKNIVPERVRIRRDKTNFIESLLNAYLCRAKSWFSRSYYKAPQSVYHYVKSEETLRMFEKCMSSRLEPSLLQDLHKMLRFISLSKWLERFE